MPGELAAAILRAVPHRSLQSQLTDRRTILRHCRRERSSTPSSADSSQAAVRYPVRMWGAHGWGRFIPAGVSRGQVDAAPAWIFPLVGPRPVDWRYAVVRDSDQVLAWELTGDDARRLFHMGASEGAPT